MIRTYSLIETLSMYLLVQKLHENEIRQLAYYDMQRVGQSKSS